MENHDGEHGDFDREDIEHMENMLYANIHYNSGSSSPNPAATNNTSDSVLTDGKETESKNDSGRRNTKRYWSNTNTPSTSKKPNFSQFSKEKPFGNHKTSTPKPAGGTTKDGATEAAIVPPEPPAPKQFTPYVPFLQFNESTSNVADEPAPTVDANKDRPVVNTTVNETARINSKNKKLNPFSKTHMIDQYKSMFTNENDKSADKASNKRLNPFNALSKKAKKKKSDTNQNKSTTKSGQSVGQPEKSKSGATAAAVVAGSSKNADVIDVDPDEDDEDDDVIILPTQAPPLICVDSSDEESHTATNAPEHAFTEPTAVTDSRRKQGRCTSPSSSIQSADDFIAQNDQHNFGFESFGTLSDEDLCQVSESVENELHNNKGAPNSKTNKRGSPKNNDKAIFTPPKQMQKEKVKTNASSAKKSYEVAANSFAAVDVYESESSDMPDSIYSKGITSKRKNLSDSDSSSSLESIQIAKSKRLRKRKCSGSAKESDVHTNDSSSDLPTDDDDDDGDDDDISAIRDGMNSDASNANSYLVPGEALGKFKSTNKKKKGKKSLEKRPQDDFLNKLTSLVVPDEQNESDENDDLENARETSTESVAARDIVETVLQRRTKKSKRNQATDNDSNNDASSWAVTDQIGETDDMNIATIIDGNSKNDKSTDAQGTEDNNTNISEKSIKSNPLGQSSEPDQQNPSNQTNDSSELNEPNASDDVNANAVDDNHIFDREIAWNDEMRRFYNDSWGGETFSLRNIRARMPKGFLNWMISNRDKSLINTRRQIRCMNCQHYGHPAKNCPQPPASKRCYMCGNEGHLQPRCPNKICYLCGEKAQKFTHGCAKCNRDRDRFCYECKQKGHRANVCPDKWRRYHSTTSLDQPILVQETSTKPSKPKYCCLCAQKGHEAHKCHRPHRVLGPLSVHVMNYSPVLRAPSNEENKQKPTPKCTILASHISDYSFNFGNDVSYKGNSMYARFRRAVNLSDDPQNQSGSNEVMFVSETNLHDTSEPPIEVYDDDFGYDEDYDNISSTEHFSSDTHDNSFVTIDNADTEEDNHSAGDYAMDNQKMDAAAENAKIQELDEKMQTLSDLKEKMLGQPSTKPNNQNDEDRDIDVRELPMRQNDDISSTAPLADFIPLNSNEPDKYQPTRSPSPVSADSTTAINERTDATIHLTPEHCKHLVNEKGHQFLRNRSEHFNVLARLEWRNFGNVLIVNGTPAGQKDFHNELKEFFKANEPVKPKYNSFVSLLPKNRGALIKCIRGYLLILDSPICNKLSDPVGLHHRICFNLQNPSKASMKQAAKFRKQLNMILFGRYGFADGRTHLDELQNYLRAVISNNSIVNVTHQVRKRIAEHIDYIFSDMDHGNYEAMIDHYNTMKRNKSLPPLKLIRNLLGLKINVLENGNGNENAPRGQDYQKNAPSTMANSSFGHGNGNGNGNGNNNSHRMNALPTSKDIQINVSNPSTSHHNQPVQNYAACLDKWNAPRGQDYQRNAPSTMVNSSFGHGNGNGNGNNNSYRMNALPTSKDIQINVSNPSTSHHNQTNQKNYAACLDKWKY